MFKTMLKAVALYTVVVAMFAVIDYFSSMDWYKLVASTALYMAIHYGLEAKNA